LAVEAPAPRLSWRVESDERGQLQTAYRLRVASTRERLAAGESDLWDSGKVSSDSTIQVRYAGRPLGSRQGCWWSVKVWDRSGVESEWSEPGHWTRGLLGPEDWRAEWISARDTAPLPTSREELFLPPARYYRKEFAVSGPVRRVLVHG